MSSQDTPRCSRCGDTNKREIGRVCSSCGSYFHLACAKLTQKSSAALTRWLCPTCLPLNSCSSSQPTHHSSSSIGQSDTQYPNNPTEILHRIYNLRSSTTIPTIIPKYVSQQLILLLQLSIKH